MAEISNQAVAEVLRQIGEYLAMQQVQFKPRAFEKAAETVGRLRKKFLICTPLAASKRSRKFPA